MNKNRLEILPYEQPESFRSLFPLNDGYLLDSERIGNFEWWYFDCIDVQNKFMLKIVIHLGTDPLRKKFFPTFALSLKCPEATRSFEFRYNLNDFHANKDFCDIRIRQYCHIYAARDNTGDYHIDLDIPEFRASLIFKQALPAWIPPSYKTKLTKGDRSSEFFWNVQQPKAMVNGNFKFNNISYNLNNAIGYHDHNYWQLKSVKGLFIDEVFTRWYWGKCIAGQYTIIFAEIWMDGVRLRSIMVSENDKILYSTDKNIAISIDEEQLYQPLKSKYPSKITIQITNEEFPLEIVLNCEELIEWRDLLKGVNPIISWVVKNLISRPSYYGIHATALIRIKDQKLNGFAFYESMIFRNN